MILTFPDELLVMLIDKSEVVEDLYLEEMLVQCNAVCLLSQTCRRCRRLAAL